MHYAAARGSVGSITMLIENGARADIVDANGCQPLYYGSQGGHVDAVCLLLEHGAHADRETLHVAVSCGHVDCVKALLAAGAGAILRNQDSSIWYQLATAIERDQASMVQCLAPYVGPAVRDSAVIVAVRNNSVNCLSLLLEHGGNPDAVDENSLTALHIAVARKHSQVVTQLLKYKGSVNMRLHTNLCFFGNDFHVMCKQAQLEYVTPLIVAVLLDHTSLLAPLIAAGASLNGVQELLDNPAIRPHLPELTANAELEAWLSECCHTPHSLKLQSTLAIRACFSSENICQMYIRQSWSECHKIEKRCKM